MTGSRAIFPDCPAHLHKHISPDHRRLVPELDIPVDAGTPESRAAALAGCDAAVLYVLKFTEAVMAAHPRLRTLVYLSTGVASHVDMAAAEARGIAVCNVPGYSTRAVAEHAIGLMLAAARRIATMDRTIRAGNWQQLGGVELGGRTLGVVGLGEIARQTAHLAQALGMRVVACNRTPRQGPWQLMPVDEVLRQADIVTLHVAHTPETDGLLDRRRLAVMKPGAILVNVSRGLLIDEDALHDALKSGHLAHAGLDVFANEPLSGDQPLARLDNVTLTSHSAWYTAEATQRLLDSGFAALREELDRLPDGRGAP